MEGASVHEFAMRSRNVIMTSLTFLPVARFEVEDVLCLLVVHLTQVFASSRRQLKLCEGCAHVFFILYIHPHTNPAL